MVKWPDGSARSFNHKRAGWALVQKHAEARCDDCHADKFQVPGVKALSVRKTGQGYTGLDTTCTSCHEDVHRGALKQNCTVCHDAGSWTVTPGFNHDTTAYTLTEKHAEVKCDKCHLDARLSPRSDGKGHLVPVYKPVSFETCASCHADPHNGGLGPKCADCHSTMGFQIIDKNRFDHDRTAYPLRGRHLITPCASCHKDFSTPALKKPVFTACTDCHSGAHNGTATLAGRRVDCASCHSVSGFAPSTYTTASHATTAYPLEGQHLAVKCAACHTRSSATGAATTLGSAKVVMRPKYDRCVDCHADDHGGQLKASTSQGECASCHRVTGWTPSTFDSAAHAQTKLALDGRHQEIDCVVCHGVGRALLPPMTATPALGKARFRFQLAETECVACHVDPHTGRFARGGARAQPSGCPTCHSTRVFRPSTTTVSVHGLFDFPLEGAHRATACSACHEELIRPPATQAQSTLVLAKSRFGVLQFTAMRACADCHETPHGDQFAAWDAKGGCHACHTVDAFAPAAAFNHETDASFRLTGAHETLPCGQCHVRDAAAPPTEPLRYRPLSGRCETCHGKESQ